MSQFQLKKKKILIDASTIKLTVYQEYKERFRFPILLKFISIYYIFVLLYTYTIIFLESDYKILRYNKYKKKIV